VIAFHVLRPLLILLELGRKPVNPKPITEAIDPDLRASVAAMRRAAALTRETAIRTDTDLVVVKNGQLIRIPAEALRVETSKKSA
jgi:hypothetical protein